MLEEGLKQLREEEQKRLFKKFFELLDSLANKGEIPITDLFSEPFMSCYTAYPSLDAMFRAKEIETDTDYEQMIQSEDWNLFIAENTSFHSWREMKEMALSKWITSRLKETLCCSSVNE